MDAADTYDPTYIPRGGANMNWMLMPIAALACSRYERQHNNGVALGNRKMMSAIEEVYWVSKKYVATAVNIFYEVLCVQYGRMLAELRLP